MRSIRKIAALGAAAVIASLGFAAVPAMAAGPPPNAPCPVTTTPVTGQGSQGAQEGDCAVTGTATIGASWAIGTDFNAFTIGTTQPTGNAGDVLVFSNALSTSGGNYTITETSTAYTGPSGTFPASDVNAGSYMNLAAARLTTPQYFPIGQMYNTYTFAAPNNPTTTLTTGQNELCPTANQVANWDCWAVPNYYLNTTTGIAAGTYTGTVDFDLWQN